jgi:hypothetical protein
MKNHPLTLLDVIMECASNEQLERVLTQADPPPGFQDFPAEGELNWFGHRPAEKAAAKKELRIRAARGRQHKSN